MTMRKPGMEKPRLEGFHSGGVTAAIGIGIILVAVVAIGATAAFSLSGKIGPRGIQGLPGDPGPRGFTGDIGPRGEKGDTGPTASWDTIPDKPTFSAVALTGDYNDLINTPPTTLTFRGYGDTPTYSVDGSELINTLYDQNTNNPYFRIGNVGEGYSLVGRIWARINNPVLGLHWALFELRSFYYGNSEIETTKVELIDSNNPNFQTDYNVIGIVLETNSLIDPNDHHIDVKVALFRNPQSPNEFNITLVDVVMSGVLDFTTLPERT